MQATACREDFPSRFFQDVYRRVCDSYATAHDILAQQFDFEGEDEPEFRNTLPWFRRGLVEQALRISGQTFANDLNVTCEPSGGFWNHRKVVGGRIQLTQCTHDDVGKPLRRARYKEQYAQQQLLFDIDDLVECPHIYAVLLHYGAWNATDPEFVVIKFPDSDLSWHPAIIDLTAEFESSGAEGTTPVEEVPDSAVPILRRRRNAGG